MRTGNQNRSTSSQYRLGLLGLALGVSAATLTGCGVTAADIAAAPIKAAPATLAITGNVHGGQQPVAGATIQLYATNSTGGYGSGSYPLLNTAVVTGSTGAFTITGDYSCPSKTAQVYITAVGGNPGLSTNNPNLSMLAALGPCGNLTPNTFVSINELTTVASVYALAPFMSSVSAVGTSTGNPLGLTNAFATVNKLTNVGSGAVPGTALPTGATVPTAELNTLADIIASCINSTGGVAGDGSACGKLFSYTTPTSGSAPTDTVGALLQIAKTPSVNVNLLIALVTPSAPFQPSLAAATDFTVSIKYKPVLSTPSASAIDPAGNVWITNAGNNTLTVVNPVGTSSTYSGGGLAAPSSVAIDASGNAWVTDKSTNAISVFTPSGVGTLTTAAYLSGPSGIAIDGQNNLWVTNTNSNDVETFTTSGTTVTGSTTYKSLSLNGPVAIAINPK